MDEIHGPASVRVAATPQAVFGLITDVGRLPERNAAIEAVATRPAALAEGPIRKRQLAGEVPRFLSALASALAKL
jgi:hypothetical protein